MNANWLICLLAIVVCAQVAALTRDIDGNGDEERDRRSVQSLVDGIIDAITHKHAARSTKSSNIVPKTSALKSTSTTAPATAAPLRQLRIPEQSTMPTNFVERTIASSKSDLINDDVKVRSTNVTSTEAFITPPTFPDETTTAATSISDVVALNVEPRAAEPRSNLKADIEAIESIEPRQNRRPRVLSGRYTQYWGNPLFFQSQYSPLYPFAPFYNDIDFNTVDVGPQLVVSVT